MPRNPILVVAESAPEASRYMEQLVDYHLLLLYLREIVEVFRDNLNCIVSFHGKATLPDPRERVHPGDCAS